MTKVLVIYYSSWGHMEAMANAAAEGAKSAGATVDVKRVAETVPEDIQKAYHYKMDQKAPVAVVDDLANYDAIIFATPTRYGMMAGQMKNFIDQTGGAKRRADRQSWFSNVWSCQPTWRPRINNSVFPHFIASPGHGDCRPALFIHGPNGP